MDGGKAVLVLADPPYGIKLETGFEWSKGNKKMGIKPSKGYQEVIGDDIQFDYRKYEQIRAKEEFWWGADYYIDTLPSFGKDGSWIVWDKKNDDLSNVWTNEFELLWSKKKHKRIVLRVLWNGALGTESEDTKTRLHPTQKSIRVCGSIIGKYSQYQEIILDPFGGSGSTLIACEQLKRKCYMMEISPQYIDVIISRWEKFTGKTAIQLS